jgi:prepilin-type N-terminal cleavage/methylation domain-containing protein/prepilin-type processing-associated H-X9-DG protein
LSRDVALPLVSGAEPAKQQRHGFMKKENPMLSTARARERRSGFTLVELLVVIAIIGVLVALLLPAVQSAREAARRTACQNKFKQVGIGLQNYHSTYKTFPPGTKFTQNTSQTDCPKVLPGIEGFGWGAFILPFIEQSAIYDQLDFTKNVYTGVNWDASVNLIDVYVCPSETNEALWVDCCTNKDHGGAPENDWRLSNMAGIGDSVEAHCWQYQPHAIGRGVLFNYSKVSVAKITDGTSNTSIVGEIVSARGSDAAGVKAWIGLTWVTRGISDVAEGINGPGTIPGGRDDSLDPFDGDGGNRHDEYHRENGLSSYHPGGAHILFADGSTQFVSEDISQNVLLAQATRADNEVVSDTTATGVSYLPPSTGGGSGGGGPIR